MGYDPRSSRIDGNRDPLLSEARTLVWLSEGAHRLSGRCPVDVPGLSWGCPVATRAVPGFVHNLTRGGLGAITGLSRGCTRAGRGFPRVVPRQSGGAPGLPRGCPRAVQGCPVVVPGLARGCPGTILGSPGVPQGYLGAARAVLVLSTG
ncbi:hypothetical protein L484_006474 [Morus notabilis]|uniref:Uncharacterized protein n=1 Tax=Morus notabilis TaxID=981085 RepID=W9SK52_9ROSA|nr:hypothetical protein L484_006474 [Morus notabilis]